MANYTSYIKRFFNLDFATLYKDFKEKRDPDEFQPNGSQIYHGYQGEGKTLSMYHHFTKLKERYPRALVVSNLKLNNFKSHQPKNLQELEALHGVLDTKKEYLLFGEYDELVLHLRNTRNGKFGVIFLIDEIHNYFHSHDSKSMPMWIVQVFSQQRKQRLIILGTVQDWPDVIKAVRRQVDNLIECKRIGYVIRNYAVDPRTIENQYGEQVASVRKKGFFFITEKLRKGFDTFQVINSGREIMGGAESPTVAVYNQQPKSARGWSSKRR